MLKAHAILAEVNKAGAKKSVKQYRDKLRNLKMQYTKAKQHNKGTGNSPMYSPHYDELDEVLGTRAVITMPGVLQAGTPASECSTPGPQLDDRQHVSESEEEDVPLAEVARKRTAANPAAAADKATKRKRTRKTRKRVCEEDEGVSPLQRLLEMLERQMEMFASVERRNEDLLVRLETEQRKAEQEAWTRDHEFLQSTLLNILAATNIHVVLLYVTIPNNKNSNIHLSWKLQWNEHCNKS